MGRARQVLGVFMLQDMLYFIVLLEVGQFRQSLYEDY